MTTKSSVFILFAFCIFAVYIIAGCTQQATSVPESTTAPTQGITQVPTSAGIANPASAACVKGGGEIEIRNTSDGSEYGICVFANGTACEEWALFRNEGCTADVTAAPTITAK